MQSRTRPGPATMRHHNSVIGIGRAGFAVDMAAHAFSLMDGYIYGFALQQVNLPSHATAESAELAETSSASSPPVEYPFLAGMLVEHALKPGYDYGQRSSSSAWTCPRRPRRVPGTAVAPVAPSTWVRSSAN